jgi:hypothetical protein
VAYPLEGLVKQYLARLTVHTAEDRYSLQFEIIPSVQSPCRHGEQEQNQGIRMSNGQGVYGVLAVALPTTLLAGVQLIFFLL